MADKVVKKEVEKEVKTDVKKGRRKLKRSVRKTLGALFLATSIAVAAIPVDGLQAAPTSAEDSNWGTLDDNMNKAPGTYVPKIAPGGKIYTTGDGLYQFGCDMEGNSPVAVLLGYTASELANNALEIPERVDAYSNFTANIGDGGGYTAVSRNNEFLYYPVYTTRTEIDETASPAPGEPQPTKEVWYIKEFRVCYFSKIGEWSSYVDLGDNQYTYNKELGQTVGETRKPSDFYYYLNNSVSGDPVPASSEDHQWMQSLPVRYIGTQTLKVGTDKKSWEVGDDIKYANRTSGIFANRGNIVSLKIPATLKGIGDYAFYSCTGLASITLANGLESIGVGSFAGCINMTQATFETFSNFNVIGDYAFYGCTALREITLPVNVTTIGNSAFENCSSMTTFDTRPKSQDGEPKNSALSSLGAHVFRGCTSLESIYIPSQCIEKIPICTFQNCSSLAFIEVANTTVDLTQECEVCSNSYTFADFMKNNPSFYVKGYDDSNLHNVTARDYEIPFSFYHNILEREVYERSVHDENDSKKVAIYQVDNKEALVGCDIPTDMVNVLLPESIGPKHIIAIGSRTFQNNCYIETITVPASIKSIEADAFKGSHSLRTVYFSAGANPTIESGAFKTQDTVPVLDDCGHHDVSSVTKDPKLYFVGEISYSSNPFLFAMDEAENINASTQNRSNIIFYSTWPTNLAVQRNNETHENELISYPILGYYTEKEVTAPTILPYMKLGEATAKIKTAVGAVNNYAGNKSLSDEEKAIIDAALNLVLPEGIESIQQGLFSKEEDEIQNVDKSITAMSLKQVDAEAFKDHKNLTSITLSDMTTEIGDHAFENCTKLRDVNISATVSKMGIQPFAGCKVLNNVNFNGGPYFTCENSIIFGLDGTSKSKLVEVLEGRDDSTIESKELAEVTEIRAEAFKGVDRIRSIDLSTSSVTTILAGTFANMEKLFRVDFPSTVSVIMDNAFYNDGELEIVKIPGMICQFGVNAFGDGKEDEDGNVRKSALTNGAFTLYVEEGSSADNFGEANNIKRIYTEPKYLVSFYYINKDGKRELWYQEEVEAGKSAAKPEDPPAREGYYFAGWDTDEWEFVEGPTTVNALYEREVDEPCIITYYYDNYDVYQTQKVAKGEDAIPIVAPDSKLYPGAPFDRWLIFGGDKSGSEPVWENIQENMSVIAHYDVIGGSGTGPSGNPGTSGSPAPGTSGSPDPGTSGSPAPGTSGSPNPGTSGSPNPGTSGSPNPGTSGDPGTSGTFYILTVQNGSGSGSYREGDQPVIIANDPATGQVFDYWSVSPEDVKIASTVLSASVITMPAKDVTVTAHYKVGSGSGNGSGGGTGNGNNTQRPNGSVEGAGGTTVVIDKNGLSNTGVVSVTVHGSSDDFVIKITDTNEATEAAVRALMAEYGDEWATNTRYFPMDISLYDSTGTYKITDTTGLSVDVTIPLPDSMITYAGNNKVASTAGGRIERLNARFSTIQGVSCITFTAEHFSPYMIYVDLGNLSSGLVSDETPKTGDGIHPKWFLSIGLACLSMVLFMQKDNKKQPKKVKVKVRAR